MNTRLIELARADVAAAKARCVEVFAWPLGCDPSHILIGGWSYHNAVAARQEAEHRLELLLALDAHSNDTDAEVA